MKKYEYVEEDGFTLACGSCGYTAPVISIPMSNPVYDGESRLVCEVCDKSQIARITDFGDYNPELFMTLGQLANLLLDKLTDRTKDKT